jgi:type I restriction enzyme S subunit
MSEWNIGTLGEIAEIIMGQSPSGDTCNENGIGTPLLNGPTEFTTNYPKPIQFTIDSRKNCEKGDLLFCVRGSTTGKMNWANQEYSIGRGLAAIRHKDDKACNRFVKAIIEYKLNDLLAGATGSTFPNVSRSDLQNLLVDLPPLPEQQAIAEVLSSIDDKIDLLHRNNKTLEEMAETLFRKWFVDGAKEEWEVGTVNSLVNIRSGYAFKSSSFVSNGRYRLITIKNVQDGYMDLSRVDFIDSIPNKTPEYCILKEGDILLSLTGNVGRCCLVEGNYLLLNQRVAKLEPKNKRDWAFTYFYFRLSSIRKNLEEISKGTAQANLSPIDTGNMELSIPSENILVGYSELATPLLQKILANKKQASELIQMRDTLLPKLMSGQVRVTV